MECGENKKRVKAFIEDRLSVSQERRFISHIGSCPSCYEEAETQYLLDRVGRTLSGENTDYDFNGAFAREVLKRRRMIFRVYLFYLLALLLFLSSLFLAAYYFFTKVL